MSLLYFFPLFISPISTILVSTSGQRQLKNVIITIASPEREGFLQASLEQVCPVDSCAVKTQLQDSLRQKVGVLVLHPAHCMCVYLLVICPAAYVEKRIWQGNTPDVETGHLAAEDVQTRVCAARVSKRQNIFCGNDLSSVQDKTIKESS